MDEKGKASSSLNSDDSAPKLKPALSDPQIQDAVKSARAQLLSSDEQPTEPWSKEHMDVYKNSDTNPAWNLFLNVLESHPDDAKKEWLNRLHIPCSIKAINARSSVEKIGAKNISQAITTDKGEAPVAAKSVLASGSNIWLTLCSIVKKEQMMHYNWRFFDGFGKVSAQQGPPSLQRGQFEGPQLNDIRPHPEAEEGVSENHLGLARDIICYLDAWRNQLGHQSGPKLALPRVWKVNNPLKFVSPYQLDYRPCPQELVRSPFPLALYCHPAIHC